MLNLSVRQLRYFDALARHRHFGRAAEACTISQPALSEQIKEMETAFGAPLFERAARQVRLTGLGDALRPRVSAILAAIEDLEGLAASHRPLRRLRLGVIPTIAPYLLPTVMRDLKRADPNLDVSVRETITSKLLEELAQGRIDAAIVALPTPGGGLQQTPLFSEQFLVVRPRGRSSAAVDLEALRRERLLLLEEGHCFREQALAVCGLDAGRSREALEASSLSTLVQMVGAGHGVTLIPEMAAPVETRSAPVAATPLAGERAARTVGMIWRKSSPLAGHLREVCDIVRRAGEALRAAPRSLGANAEATRRSRARKPARFEAPRA